MDTVDVKDEVNKEIARPCDAIKAEMHGTDVLILRRLSKPVERLDKRMASYQMEYRWLSVAGDVHAVKGIDTTYWQKEELKDWENTSLFDTIVLF